MLCPACCPYSDFGSWSFCLQTTACRHPSVCSLPPSDAVICPFCTPPTPGTAGGHAHSPGFSECTFARMGIRWASRVLLFLHDFPCVCEFTVQPARVARATASASTRPELGTGSLMGGHGPGSGLRGHRPGQAGRREAHSAGAAVCPGAPWVRCPCVLRTYPLRLAEENEVGCPEGFELDTQGEFCVGECPPLPWHGRGRPLSRGRMMCPGRLAGGPVGADHQIPPTPLFPDRDECSAGPSPCSHSCHNAPGRFSCSCPAGFALARDDRNCRGEWARVQRLSWELAWACGGRHRAGTLARGTRLRTWPVPDGTDASLGVAMPRFPWELPARRAADQRGSSPGGAGEPQRHTRAHRVLMHTCPPSPDTASGAFLTWQSFAASWGRNAVDTHLSP